MIKRGLKVGERFEDGGLYYEVQSVLPNGQYISKRVDGYKEIKEDVAEAGTADVATEQKEEIATVAEAETIAEASTAKTTQNPTKKTGVKKK